MDRLAMLELRTTVDDIPDGRLLEACAKCLRIRTITHGESSMPREACAAESNGSAEERVACSRALERVVRGEEVA